MINEHNKHSENWWIILNGKELAFYFFFQEYVKRTVCDMHSILYHRAYQMHFSPKVTSFSVLTLQFIDLFLWVFCFRKVCNLKSGMVYGWFFSEHVIKEILHFYSVYYDLFLCCPCTNVQCVLMQSIFLNIV